MLLQYHDVLLNKSIPPDYFIGLSKLNLKYVNNDLLTTGLHYPDVPCNELVITTDGKVKYLNYDTCRIPLPLLYLFDEQNNGLKQTVQSHRGRQAIGHSMTYEPTVTMMELRQKILRRLEILYMLALSDNSLLIKCSVKTCKICYETTSSLYTCIESQPNIFWLGQILHCIQDSYSRVHTLRQLPDQQPVVNQYGGQQILTTKEDKIPSFRLVRMIGDVIDTHEFKSISGSKSDIVAFLTKHITDPELTSIIRDNPNDIGHIFKLILFFKNQKRNIEQLYDSDLLPSENHKANNTSDITGYPYLISFRYIPHQSNCGRSFHMSYDSQKSTEKFERFVIENCSAVLAMYKRHILDRTDKSIQVKIDEMISYIAKNVFPILDQYKDNPSAKICSSSQSCECMLDYDKVYNLHSSNIGGKKKPRDTKKKTRDTKKKPRYTKKKTRHTHSHRIMKVKAVNKIRQS